LLQNTFWFQFYSINKYGSIKKTNIEELKKLMQTIMDLKIVLAEASRCIINISSE